MPAARDCELIRDGFLGQPANAITSLAFVVIGLWLVRRRPVLGWAGIAVGAGSFVFHGPMPGWAEWAHDTALAALPVALVLEARPLLFGVSTAALAFVLAIEPGIAERITLLLVVVAAIAIARRLPSLRLGWVFGSALIVAVGIALQVVSRTDASWCNPNSVLQGHGFWHLLGAGGLWAWSRAGELDSQP